MGTFLAMVLSLAPAVVTPLSRAADPPEAPRTASPAAPAPEIRPTEETGDQESCGG